MNSPATVQIQTAARTRYYYGWTVLVIAAAAMVGTLPGRRVFHRTFTASLRRFPRLFASRRQGRQTVRR